MKALLLGLIVCACTAGCYVVPQGGHEQAGRQEGYYDRDHNRYWHEQAWHACTGNEDACRDHDSNH
jgi:hypothetical protein